MKMRIIVTHTSPDWDAITSIWLIKKFLPGWEEAELKFVPAGERLSGGAGRLPHVANDARGPVAGFPPASARSSLTLPSQGSNELRAVGSLSTRATPRSEPLRVQTVIENINGNEVIHVDTGLGPLDHHQIEDNSQSAASRTWEFVKIQSSEFRVQNSERVKDKREAIDRIVKVVVDIDHFKEVFWDNPTADYHEFSLLGFLEGLKLQKPNEDLYYVNLGMQCLDALFHNFENRIWAEKEITEKGIKFETKWGKGIGFETINDTVLKLTQKMGYVVVVRKDPRKGYVRIKARPTQTQNAKRKTQNKEIDLTLVYEKLKKMDPEATWYLHVSKKMLLNGTPKNPKMVPTKLSLRDIIEVLKGV